MKDRVPANPGRVLISPENGNSSFYAVMTRANNPVQEGTPLNKETLLSDETAEFLGLTSEDPKVSDAFIKLGEAMSIETIREICGYGGLPSGYTLLEYIQSSGTAYLNTGVTPTNNTKIELKVSANSGNFFAAISDSVRYGVYLLSSSKRIDMAFGSTGYKGNVISGLTFPVIITMENGKITANDSEYTFTTQSAFTCASTLPIFAEGTSPSSGEVYYAKVWESGVLIRDYIPCINQNGEYGMYDKVNAEFYGSAGSGSFTGA